MAKLSDIYTEADRELHGFVCLTKGTLAINAASALTFKTTGAVSYICDGLFKTPVTLTAQAFSVGHDVLQAGQVGYYIVGLNAAGACATFQGIGVLPDVANGYTPVGIIKVTVNSGQTWQPGVDALDNATKASYAFFDCCILPSVAP